MDEEKQLEIERPAVAEGTEAAADLNSDTVEAASEPDRMSSPDGESGDSGATDIDPIVAEAEAAAQEVKERAEAETATIAKLKATAETTQAQLEDLQSQYARLAADFDNFRKRTQKEKKDLEEQTVCSTIKELLPVIDNFERARTQIKPQNEGETNIHKSYQSVYKQMVDCLKRLGVSRMRPEGEEFDPNLHEAVMREPTDSHPEGTVVAELMGGYTLADRVLRHAMVKVATTPEPVVSSEEAESDSSED
ncbi:MAG: nucleotide exchange factor GrpE [Cyanobacteria bacterium SID2]|nr:nucleotide exchange factor GrpE [Cyanobacteria bacterium SID2]MBP0004985.1 nucleotide exchange factor GrpE [Cyanobacteria bacterium SBC]